MKITFNFKNKKFPLKVKHCGLFGMVRGLMFRRRKNAPALLLFDFKKPRRLKIHSWFVFFPFFAVWLDDKNRIIEMKKILPWKTNISPRNKFNKLVEIPYNKKYDGVLASLVES